MLSMLSRSFKNSCAIGSRSAHVLRATKIFCQTHCFSSVTNLCDKVVFRINGVYSEVVRVIRH